MSTTVKEGQNFISLFLSAIFKNTITFTTEKVGLLKIITSFIEIIPSKARKKSLSPQKSFFFFLQQEVNFFSARRDF